MDGYIWGHWRCLLYLNFSYSRLNTACQGARQEHRQLRGDTRKWQFGLLRRKLCYDLFFSFLADFWFDSYCALSCFLCVCFLWCRFQQWTPAIDLQSLLSFYTGNYGIYVQSVKCKTTWIPYLFKCWNRLVCHCVMWEVKRVKVWGLGFDRGSCDLESYFSKFCFNKEKARQQIRRAFWFYRKISKMYKPEMERILCGIKANNTLRFH